MILEILENIYLLCNKKIIHINNIKDNLLIIYDINNINKILKKQFIFSVFE